LPLFLSYDEYGSASGRASDVTDARDGKCEKCSITV